MLTHNPSPGSSKKSEFRKEKIGSIIEVLANTASGSPGSIGPGLPVGVLPGSTAPSPSTTLFSGMDSGSPSVEVVASLSSSNAETDAVQQQCTSFFLDPDVATWVSEESRNAWTEGETVEPDTIYCPNARCHCKIGTQSWSGTRCSCGAWVTPAFKILKKSVDKLPL